MPITRGQSESSSEELQATGGGNQNEQAIDRITAVKNSWKLALKSRST